MKSPIVKLFKPLNTIKIQLYYPHWWCLWRNQILEAKALLFKNNLYILKNDKVYKKY